MNRTPNRLSGVPLSPFSWQIEAFQASADARARAAVHSARQMSDRDRLWVKRGERLGEQLRSIVAYGKALRQRLVATARDPQLNAQQQRSS